MQNAKWKIRARLRTAANQLGFCILHFAFYILHLHFAEIATFTVLVVPTDLMVHTTFSLQRAFLPRR
jgi:hypothetical protein